MKVEIEITDFDSFEAMLAYPVLDMHLLDAETIFKSLPRDIKFEAYEWGCSDSVFRDRAYAWLLDHKAKTNE